MTVGVVGLMTLSGCQTSPYQKGNSAADSLKRAAFEVQQERRALDSVTEAIESLLNKPASDLRPQYTHYSATLDRLTAADKRVVRTGHEIQKAGAGYLEAWDKQLLGLNYEAVREKSKARRDEVAAALAAVNERYQETGSAVNPLISYLEDLHKALGADLTIGGVSAAKPIGENAKENAGRVQTALEKLQSQLDDLASKLSSTVSTPGA
jgi:chromosome segregation ATPase